MGSTVSTSFARGGGPLVERDGELTELARALDAARVGDGRIAFVEGPAGIGKTRLLDAAVEHAEGEGFHVLFARGTELEREFSFGVVRQLFESLVRGLRGNERDELLQGAAALTVPLFGDEPSEGRASALDPSFATLHGLYWLLSNLSETQPLVLIVDDAHWADPPSLRFLAFLTGRARELPVLVLLAARPREPGSGNEVLASIADDPDVLRLRVGPLSGSASAAIIRARFEQEADSQFCQACHDATAGNPFFLGALIDELLREEVAPRADAVGEVPSIGPETVSRAVRLRLGRLPVAAPALARAVAVLGDGSEFRHAMALAGLPDAEARDAADALTRAEIFRRGDQLAFVHPIVRAAIYADLAPRERSAAHARAARLFGDESAAPGRIASHLLATDPIGDEWVARQLRAAAREAASRGATEIAVPQLRRALREPVADEEKAELLLELARAERNTDVSSAIDHLTESLELSTSPELRARAASDLATALLVVNRGSEAMAVVDRVVTELPATERELCLSLEADLAAVAHMLILDVDQVAERLERLEHELEGETPAERRLLAILAYHKTTRLASADEVAYLAERALGEGRLVSEAELESLALFYPAYLLGLADRFELAERTWTELINRARAQGSLLAFSIASCQRGLARFRRGALDDALADSQSTLETAGAYTWPMILHYGLAVQTRVLIERGELEQAERELAARGADGELPNTTASTVLLIDRGKLRLAQRRPEQALSDLQEAGRRAAQWGSSIVFDWRPVAALAHHAVGDQTEALKLAQEELHAARAWGAPRILGLALSTLGLIEGDGHGIEHLRQAVAVLEPSPALVERARALVNLGAVLRRSRHPADAREPLRAGLELANRCRATALAARAEDELAATGERRRKRTMLSGADALTPSERRVAEMAAEGMTNPQIAQALFVTRKTVEMHLGNAYRKLDIHSREQLPKALTGR